MITGNCVARILILLSKDLQMASFRSACLLLMATFACAQAFAQQSLDSGLKDDGQWAMPAKDYAATRFSNLAEVNSGNVRQLQVAWTFST